MVVEVERSQKCPACGTPLSRDGWSEGLCPLCVFELALDDTGLEAELEPDEAPTLQFTPGTTFFEGDIQGDRYRIRSLLGRGGMGEVWRAYDLKLRQDVALKALRTELIEDQVALEILRQEVRAAREVISPNVCRVFDLQEVDGQELISMEYVDGTTLQEILREPGPLELNEAREIASQFLAGLEAIHAAGLVHRDIKPENIMVTRTGRVVVMDFGIAKGLGEGRGGVVAGTPAYMSPEQARGHELDARSDLFAAGVVLAEMVEPGGISDFEDRKRVWEGIHQSTPQISETPWSKVIAKCVSAETRDRFESAAALARALEEVTLRAAGDETARPYPGLSAFQQEDAEFFYGRELEVEALWKKLRRPHLLAVIGPSGAGKSSFLRAGLLPTLTDGWQAAIATPGNRPFANLARALAEQLPEDRATVDALLRFEESETAIDLIKRWHQGHKYGLIILDQFEELFTQNPDDTQQAFAELLGRLPLEADVYVLLSMRDDFLFYCQAFESLAPVFSEMTPLGPPTGASLRRAIVEPALKCGYRFEDEAIVEEMLGEVEGQRGALPLLAFAAAQLWERRDRDSGLMTRKAYEQIGGVSGALAQHAEAMLDYVGEANAPIVRELFRNLVTAQGTRASRERDELLSVFPETEGEPFLEPSEVRPIPVLKPARPAAKHVLNTLIDVRLLTSYEIPADEENGEPHHRIEIIHESLLANWPRLVRWQRQDADSAQMRDELRSQAKLWDEHGRSEDYLWTGTAFKEYALWRESYPGGLTEVEEAFGAAMVHLAERQRRRRRIVVTTVIAALVVGLSIVAGFWHQAVQERVRAEAETRRAEAGKLLALAELEIDSYPTAALARATKSLELADTREGRLFALRALHRGPPVRVDPAAAEEGGVLKSAFSPSGEWFASEDRDQKSIWLRHQDGGEPRHLFSYPEGGLRLIPAFESDEVLVTSQEGDVRWLSVPDGTELRPAEAGRGRLCWLRGDGYFSVSTSEDRDWIRWWPLGEGASRLVGSMETIFAGIPGSEITYNTAITRVDVDATGSWLAYRRNNTVYVRSLKDWSRAPVQIGEHGGRIESIAFHPDGDRLAVVEASGDRGGIVKIWSTVDGRPSGPQLLRSFETVTHPVLYDPSGRWLAGAGMEEGRVKIWLWDMTAPEGVEPLILSRTDIAFFGVPRFHPSEPWMVTGVGSAGFWPLSGRYPWVLRAGSFRVSDVAFSPDESWLVSATQYEIRAWPLQGQNSGASRVLVQGSAVWWPNLLFHPAGEYVASSSTGGGLSLVPLAGGPVRRMPTATSAGRIAFSPNGRLLATSPYTAPFPPPAPGMPAIIQVWDLESDTVQDLGPVPGFTSYLGFDDDRRLRWAGGGGSGTEGSEERVFDLENGSVELVAEKGREWGRAMSSAGDLMLVVEDETDGGVGFFWKQLQQGESRRITSHGAAADLRDVEIDPSDRWFVSGDQNGTVRVGLVSGEEPHLLLGHQGSIGGLAVPPSGRWLASAAEDGTIRIWPTPDLSKPPLHALPHDELIAKLHSLTNVRAVEDPDSPTGWRIDYAPFPGWKEVPTWQ